jgi:chaperonin GroES
MADESKKNVQMLGKFILMQRDKPVEQRTPGGIIKPTSASVSPTWGNVIGIGPGTEPVKIGDRILVGKYAGSDVQVNGEPAVVVNIDDVYGIER